MLKLSYRDYHHNRHAENEINDEIATDNKRHGELIGRLSIIMFIVTLCYLVATFLLKLPAPWGIYLALSICSFIAYFLNRYGKQAAAKYFGLISFNLIIYCVASSESHRTNVNLYFATGGISALVLFDYSERIKSFLFIGLSLLLYLIARFLEYSPIPTRTFTPDQTMYISLINLFVFVYVTAYLIVLLLRSNNIRKVNLIKQNSELVKTNVELDRFIYSSSHDLRAPLSSLLGLIQLMEIEDEKPNHSNYLKLMKGRINSMDVFIRDIMDYAKNIRQEVLREPIHIKSILQAVLDDLKYMEKADTLMVTFVDMDELILNTDPVRIKIIFSNLISNAIKYQDACKAQSTLTINTVRTETHLTIAFVDNGLGIPPNNQKNIFNMFFRAHEISTGSGLGLYLVKETLANLDGTIQVESKEKEGSRFTINLPI